MKNKTGLPVHPGEILRGALLPQFGLTATEAAIGMRVSPELMFEILDERKPISAEMCLRIARFFDSSPEMWQRLQGSYDLHVARQDEYIAQSVRSIVPVLFFNEASA